MTEPLHPIDCGCVIHGDAYSWLYVERLHSMLVKNFNHPIRMHVWTESDRPVPDPFIKHELVEWAGVHGPRRAWWYKMQIFNDEAFQGRMLYFDLDVVITGNLDFLLQSSPKYFWCIRDFRYLWRPQWQGLNSSVMFWDTKRFRKIWKNFRGQNIHDIMRRYAGDQDYLTAVIDAGDRRFFDEGVMQSYRWQIQDGGMDMNRRVYKRPGAGAVVTPGAKVIVFHGRPKPHEAADAVIDKLWR